jgi:hypothetical protein
MTLVLEISLLINLLHVLDLEHLMEEMEVQEGLLFLILINKINAQIIFLNLIILEKKLDMKDQEELVVILQNKQEDQEEE